QISEDDEWCICNRVLASSDVFGREVDGIANVGSGAIVGRTHPVAIFEFAELEHTARSPVPLQPSFHTLRGDVVVKQVARLQVDRVVKSVINVVVPVVLRVFVKRLSIIILPPLTRSRAEYELHGAVRPNLPLVRNANRVA